MLRLVDALPASRSFDAFSAPAAPKLVAGEGADDDAGASLEHPVSASAPTAATTTNLVIAVLAFGASCRREGAAGMDLGVRGRCELRVAAGDVNINK